MPGSIIKRVPWRVKPDHFVGIDWSHPIARGLVFFADARGTDWVSGTLPTLYGANISDTVSSVGRVAESTSTTNSGVHWEVDKLRLFEIANRWTIATHIAIDSMVSWTSIVSIPWENGWTTPYHTLALLRQSAEGKCNVTWASNGGSYHRVRTPDTGWLAADGAFHSLAVTKPDGVLSDATLVKFYKDGVQTTGEFSASSGSRTEYVDFNGANYSGHLLDRNHDYQGEGVDGRSDYVAFWKRDLTKQEIVAFQRDPWQILQPRRLIIPVGTAAAGVTATPSGVAATGGVGTPTATGAALFSLTGTAATSAAGTAAATGAAIIAVDGVATTSAPGAPTITAAAQVGVTGTQATASAGDMTPIGHAIVALTGTAATGALGTITVVTADSITVSVTGVQGAPAAGVLAATGAAIVPVTGLAATGSAGTIDVQGGAQVSVVGTSATGQVGTITVSVAGAVSVALSGVSATAQAATLQIAAGALVEVTGVQSNASPGTVAAVIGQTVALTGISASAVVGVVDITAAAVVVVDGVQADGEAGAIAFATSGIAVPGHRVYTIQAEDRTYLVIAEDRTHTVH